MYRQAVTRISSLICRRPDPDIPGRFWSYRKCSFWSSRPRMTTESRRELTSLSWHPIPSWRMLAYSGDVKSRFQRDENGHSGDVNKVGAQRRWDYKLQSCPIPSILIKVVHDSYSALFRFCFLSLFRLWFPFSRFSQKNVALGSPQGDDCRLGRPTASLVLSLFGRIFTFPK